jgi:hypothetical protein|tara:strand:+ start:2854 stop:2967 length:114 start_codon:yes stop_codon:yes gene_type:complete
MGLEALGGMAVTSFKGMGSGIRASGEGLASFFNMFRK